ncbi:DUF6924 domain-containing protein [Streptomyces sp. MMS24-I31]|uniref:DUF6924 domain-containing protein n=1 Tax=Streptomyces sp. MMS24-I31 TaxID=3351563 RepID=UPI003896E29F
MSFPKLPQPTPGEVLLVCTCYEDGRALWGGLLDEIGARREDDGLVFGGSGVRLRIVADGGWDYLHGGNIPALVPDSSPVPPVVVLADILVVYGGDGPLLVDLAAIPGVASGCRRPGWVRSSPPCRAAHSPSTTWCATWTGAGCTRAMAAGRHSPRRRRAGSSCRCPPPPRPCWSAPASTTRRVGAPCSTNWAAPTQMAGSARTRIRTRST